MSALSLTLCCRQKLVLHASKARSLFTEECAMKYRLFISKSEEWMRYSPSPLIGCWLNELVTDSDRLSAGRSTR